MKTLEQLRNTPLPQLKAIAKDLQITFNHNIGLEKLAVIVFNAQQPDEEQLKQDEANVDDAKEKQIEHDQNQPDAEHQVDAMLQKIADFFGGELDEVEDTGVDGFVFAVVDAVGEVIVKGTYAELMDKMEEIEKIRAAEAFQSAKNMREAQVPIDPSTLIPDSVERGVAAPAATSDQLNLITSELSSLTKLGLKSNVTNDSVELSFGGRNITTTVHQPVHRIIRLAEQMLARI